MLHVTRHSTEECKVLEEYSAKYSEKRPHNEKEARSGGNKKYGKTVKFDDSIEDVKNMVAHDAPIPRKKKEKIWHKF